jgi:hypothetical protein
METVDLIILADVAASLPCCHSTDFLELETTFLQSHSQTVFTLLHGSLPIFISAQLFTMHVIHPPIYHLCLYCDLSVNILMQLVNSTAACFLAFC